MAQPPRVRTRVVAASSPAMDVLRAADFCFGMRVSLRARAVRGEPMTCAFAHGKADAYAASPHRADLGHRGRTD
ncbi:hypothetical protein Scani_73790 [Streptomyces caniferus]|uniref:Uncharacterized protein n=1 Tax=Streptomyces caniferus TaxID=285557 RepID=A0A640SLA9_9ACTN|nr:hypothetical protein Scani_73790 [Streptomyces caniferus]